MSIILLHKDFIDFKNAETNSIKTYTSSSNKVCSSIEAGITGSVPASRTSSNILKDVSLMINESEDSRTLKQDVFKSNVEGHHSGEVYVEDNTNEVVYNADPLSNKIDKNLTNLSSEKYQFLIQRRDQPKNPFDIYQKEKDILRNIIYPSITKSDGRFFDLNWGFTNYNCINFFSLGEKSNIANSKKLTHQCCLVYSNENNKYLPENDDFTIEFYINPKYTNFNNYNNFNPGCILFIPHMISIFLVKGSSYDEYGKTNGFRILAQVGKNAANDNIGYSLGLLGGNSHTVSDANIKVLSSDNLLKKNHWHKVTLTYKKDFQCNLYIDGVLNKSVETNNSSTSIFDKTKVTSLYIGNRPKNIQDSNESKFFCSQNAENYDLTYNSGSLDTPSRGDLMNLFSNDLSSINESNGDNQVYSLHSEIHDIRIYKSTKSLEKIQESLTKGISNLEKEKENGLIFYLPLNFISENIGNSSIVNLGNSLSKIVENSFVNKVFSNNCLGHEVSIEHFLRDAASSVSTRPMLVGLSSNSYYNLDYSGANQIKEGAGNNSIFKDPSASDIITDNISSFVNDAKINSYSSYWTGNIIHRNHFIMPCDNGIFTPNFDIITEIDLSLSSSNFYKDDSNFYKSSFVSCRNILSGTNNKDFRISNLDFDIIFSESTTSEVEINSGELDNFRLSNCNPLTKKYFKNNLIVRSHEEKSNFNIYSLKYAELKGGIKNTSPDILQEELIMDPSDNHTVVINFPKHFYSSEIKRKSLTIKDNDIPGTIGNIQVTLKDNGKSGLYRADCLTEHAEWNTVGNILYNDGSALIFHPSLYSLGRYNLDVTVAGTRGLYIHEVNVPCPSGMINKSTNVNYKSLKASSDAFDHEEDFVYITGINLHDENMNIVAKARLAKPIKKRSSDKMLFRLRMDF